MSGTGSEKQQQHPPLVSLPPTLSGESTRPPTPAPASLPTPRTSYGEILQLWELPLDKNLVANRRRDGLTAGQIAEIVFAFRAQPVKTFKREPVHVDLKPSNIFIDEQGQPRQFHYESASTARVGVQAWDLAVAAPKMPTRSKPEPDLNQPDNNEDVMWLAVEEAWSRGLDELQALKSDMELLNATLESQAGE